MTAATAIQVEARTNAVTNTLNFLAANAGTVIQVLAGIAGALATFAGIATFNFLATQVKAFATAVTAAFTIAQAEMFQYSETQLAAAMTTGELDLALESLAAAETAGTLGAVELEAALAALTGETAALDVAMNANPIGPFLTILGNLALAAGGAYIAMDAMKGMMNAVQV